MQTHTIKCPSLPGMYYSLQAAVGAPGGGGGGTLRIPASVFRPTFLWFREACKSRVCSLICSSGHGQVPALCGSVFKAPA